MGGERRVVVLVPRNGRESAEGGREMRVWFSDRIKPDRQTGKTGVRAAEGLQAGCIADEKCVAGAHAGRGMLLVLEQGVGKPDGAGAGVCDEQRHHADQGNQLQGAARDANRSPGPPAHHLNGTIHGKGIVADPAYQMRGRGRGDDGRRAGAADEDRDRDLASVRDPHDYGGLAGVLAAEGDGGGRAGYQAGVWAVLRRQAEHTVHDRVPERVHVLRDLPARRRGRRPG
eukprot:588204-Rhodomonas_salina.3